MTNKKGLGLAIPIVLHRKLQDKAKYQGKTINALCLEIFWKYFEERTEESERKSS